MWLMKVTITVHLARIMLLREHYANDNIFSTLNPIDGKITGSSGMKALVKYCLGEDLETGR